MTSQTVMQLTERINNMKLCANYFDVVRHLEEDKEDDFTWTSIDSTGLTEVMELASSKGYRYHLNCYDTNVYGGFTFHRREMVFTKKEDI